MRARDLLVSTLLGTALATAAPAAQAADVQACLAASEKGQRARGAGKLREAREHFLVCGGEGCPAIVRRDCSQWNSELATALPSVVFGAKDASGRDLFDVTVSMDGEPLVEKLDGKAVAVDPGPHTFRFESAGAQPVSETALIKEGERARVLSVTFAGGADDAAGATVTPAPTTTAEPGEGRGHTALPWVVVGIGGVTLVTGVVVFLTTPQRPGNCDRETKTCTRQPDQTAAEFEADQKQAGRADNQPILGGAIAGAGALILAGGLIWHFLESTGDAGAPRAASPTRMTPWMTGTAGGLSFGGTF
jgi:hypothetical protein